MSDNQNQGNDEQDAADAYYRSASVAGHLQNETLRALGLNPHYRALVGSAIIGNSVTEMHEIDAEAARSAYSELAAGLMALGRRLGYADAPKEKQDA